MPPEPPIPARKKLNWRSGLDTAGVVVFIVACVTLTYAAWHRLNPPPTATQATGAPPERPLPPEPPLPFEPIDISGSVTLGSPAAKLALVLYSDFECPFCRKFAAESLPAVKKELVDTGRVRLAFRHLPLDIHPMARKAAVAAECARGQGRFWEMHDGLFAVARPMTPAAPLEVGRSVGLKLDDLEACLAGPQSAQKVEEDIASARIAGVLGTPTLLLGSVGDDGRVTFKLRLKGAQTAAMIATAVKAFGG